MDQSRRRCNTSGIAAGIALPLGLNQVSDSEPSVLTEYTCIFYYFLELFWIIRFWNDGNCFGDPKRFVSSRFYWSMVVSAGWLPVLLAFLLEDLCVFSCRQFELQYTFCPFFFASAISLSPIISQFVARFIKWLVSLVFHQTAWTKVFSETGRYDKTGEELLQLVLFTIVHAWTCQSLCMCASKRQLLGSMSSVGSP